MKMPKDMPIQGATIERAQHSQIIIEVRTLTKGGMVESYGNRDLDHCLLDHLCRTNRLGSPQDSAERYHVGYRLRDLWFSFNESGVNLEQMGQGRKMFTSEGEVGVGNDALEAEYHSVMRALPEKYRNPVRALCIEDRLVRDYNQCLDALHGAFHRVDSKKV